MNGNIMLKRLKTIGMKLTSHSALYAGLCASHIWAAVSTGKPEIYGVMAVIYGVLAIKG